jgi:hypothetical protein
MTEPTITEEVTELRKRLHATMEQVSVILRRTDIPSAQAQKIQKAGQLLWELRKFVAELEADRLLDDQCTVHVEGGKLQ